MVKKAKKICALTVLVLMIVQFMSVGVGASVGDEFVLYGVSHSWYPDHMPNDGVQATSSIAFAPSDPDRIYHFIDVGCHMNVSLDMGKTWSTLVSYGRTHSHGMAYIEVDPFNADRIIARNLRLWEGVHPEGSMWLSEDGGVNWIPTWTPDDGYTVGYGLRINRGCAIDPASYNPEIGYCTTMYAITDNSKNNANDLDGRVRLLRSTDGGFNWDVIATPDNLGPMLRSIKLFPNDNTKLLVQAGDADGNNGVFSDINTSNPVFIPFGEDGKGASQGSPWISEDGSTIIMQVGTALKRSVNGGSSWTTIANPFPDTHPMDMHYMVNHDASRVMIYRHQTGDFIRWYYSSNDPKTSDTVEFLPSSFNHVGTDESSHRVAGSAAMMKGEWHPSNPDVFVYSAVACPWYSEDGGVTFDPGFGIGGRHFKGWAGQQWQHPTDPDKFALGLHDVVGVRSMNGETFDRWVRAKYLIGGDDNSFVVAINPNDPDYALIQIGTERSGQLLLCNNFWTPDINDQEVIVVDNVSKRRSGTCWDPFDENIAYSSDRKSIDKGLTWFDLTPGRHISAFSEVAVDGAPVLYYTISNQGTEIWKSVDRGETQTSVWTGWNTSNGGVFVPMAVDPTNPHVIYFSAGNANPEEHIMKLDTETNTISKFNILGYPTTSVRWRIDNIAVDKDPSNGNTIIYVRVEALDTGEILYGSPDGGKTWIDMNKGLPASTNSNSFRVNRLTGELHVATTGGLYIHPGIRENPPSEDTFYHRMAQWGWGNRTLEGLTEPVPDPKPLVTALAVPIKENKDIRVSIDGKNMVSDPMPFLLYGNTMVPMRTIFESLGAAIAWDGATYTATAVKGSTTVSLQIGSEVAKVNNKTVKLDSPAMLYKDRTMVPLGFVADALGAQAIWKGESNLVEISTAPAPTPMPTPTPAPTPAPTPVPTSKPETIYTTDIEELKGYWMFDETSGTEAADSSGNKNNAVMTGVAAWTTEGKYDGAISFDGIDGYVQTPFILNPASTDFTAACWIKPSSTGSQVIMTQVNEKGTGRVWLNYFNQNLESMIGGVSTISSTTLSTDEWHHIAVVKSGTTLTLYVNGLPDATQTVNAESCVGALRIGASKAAKNRYNGLIDDLRVYDVALTDSEMLEVCTTLPPMSATEPTPEPTPTSKPPIDMTNVFFESGGEVVMEAENFASSSMRDDPNSITWEVNSSVTGAVGGKYVDTPRLEGDVPYGVTGEWDVACELTYNVNFSTTGTYNIWLRKYAVDGKENSAYVGIDGVPQSAVDNQNNMLMQWVWKKFDTVEVSEPGVKVLSLRRREAGYKVDRIVLTLSDDAPTGDGPAESSR